MCVCHLPWGPQDQVFNFNTSDTYQQDWIGLRTLDAQGKVDLGSFVGAYEGGWVVEVGSFLGTCKCGCTVRVVG